MTDRVLQAAHFLLRRPRFRKLIWRFWYDFCADKIQFDTFKFINFGYKYPNDDAFTLEDEDSDDRLFIGLYHHLLSQVDLVNKDVLEVGSGRGGGCHYIKKYFNCQRVVGLDRSLGAIELSRKMFRLANLHFQSGLAEALPYESSSFDVIINVESSHCYSDLACFFSEVKRVLKAGGVFLLTDFRYKKDISCLDEKIKNAGFNVVAESDITEEVIASLQHDSNKKQALIHNETPRYLHKICHELAAIDGSRVYRGFENRDMIYKSYVLQKRH